MKIDSITPNFNYRLLLLLGMSDMEVVSVDEPKINKVSALIQNFEAKSNKNSNPVKNVTFEKMMELNKSVEKSVNEIESITATVPENQQLQISPSIESITPKNFLKKSSPKSKIKDPSLPPPKKSSIDTPKHKVSEPKIKPSTSPRKHEKFFKKNPNVKINIKNDRHSNHSDKNQNKRYYERDHSRSRRSPVRKSRSRDYRYSTPTRSRKSSPTTTRSRRLSPRYRYNQDKSRERRSRSNSRDLSKTFINSRSNREREVQVQPVEKASYVETESRPEKPIPERGFNKTSGLSTDIYVKDGIKYFETDITRRNLAHMSNEKLQKKCINTAEALRRANLKIHDMQREMEVLRENSNLNRSAANFQLGEAKIALSTWETARYHASYWYGTVLRNKELLLKNGVELWDYEGSCLDEHGKVQPVSTVLKECEFIKDIGNGRFVSKF